MASVSPTFASARGQAGEHTAGSCVKHITTATSDWDMAESWPSQQSPLTILVRQLLFPMPISFIVQHEAEINLPSSIDLSLHQLL